ncbi:MAG: ABC transporter permease [Dehalococcoidia bacterium]
MATDAAERSLELTGVAWTGERSWLGRFRRFVVSQPLGTLGMLVLVGYILVAIFAPLIATHDPLAIDASATLEGPGEGGLMGTDNFGRDIFSRIVYGTRNSIGIGFTTVILIALVAVTVGGVSGYLGGATDLLVQRVVDAFQAFPTLILAIAIVAALGASTLNVIIALTVASWPGIARVIRSQVLGLKEGQFVEAARTVGASDARIILRHLLPNVLPILLVLASASVGAIIIAEATLSFLGLGTPPPEPSWGSILTGAQRYAQRAPWIGIFPGLAITLAVFAASFLGDAIRDALDPRLRH